MSSSELSYWLALRRFPKFGPKRIGRMIKVFASMKEAFLASRNALIACGIEPKIAEQFIAERVFINPEKELEKLHQNNQQAVTLKDENYPPALKEIFDPPPVLFIRGNLPSPNRTHLAVIGSRKPTSYGLQAVRDLVEPLTRSGAVIVSGLAYGIDAEAHKVTLNIGGSTIAILGAGLDDDNLYPSQHRAIAAQIIASGGALISEHPPGTHALKHHFPARNRIIAGLCSAVLVIEATKKSGSLITARAALEQGRDVLAVPGSIYSPLSEGSNNLIKIGAGAVTSAEDVLNALNLENREAPPDYQPGSAEEETLFKTLSKEPLHIDELVIKSGLIISDTMRTLTLMEMKGSARHVGGKYYVRG